ncbi:hypothetical protein ACFRCI_30895 [Streptomyces sp. NPDC056638]|uniref:hypothetical protein n=1 Tax=Streptomyces sp. NPDC056638 TaxID=3345887 RepID=UPI00368F5361
MAQPPTPHELRPLPSSWTDREEELAAFKAWLSKQPAHAVHVIAISGEGGVGKSSLGTRLLHDLWEEFPGGQLHVDLRSHAPNGPTSVTDALSQLVGSLRSGPQPATVGGLGGRWRSVTAGLPPLTVLVDNVSCAAQVRALLPGGRGHLVVVTSRKPILDLVADGALPHRLLPFTPAVATQFLTRCLQSVPVSLPAATQQRLVRQSGGLPLALAATAALVAGSSALDDVLTFSGPAGSDTPPRPATHQDVITMTLDAAYASLPSEAATAYQRLAFLPAKDVDAELAAAVCAVPQADVLILLTALADAQLLTRADEQPGRGLVFVFHDEVHARAQAATHGEDEQEILRLALEWLIATVSAAEQLVTPSHAVFPRTYTASSRSVPLSFESEPEAMAWLESQLPNLMTAVRAAARAGLHACVWQLVHAMWPAWRHYRRYAWWIEAHELALNAVRERGNRAAECVLLNTLGVGYRGTGQHERALEAFHGVQAIAEELDDKKMIAQSLHEQGVAHRELQQYAESRPCLMRALQMREEADYVRGVGLTQTEIGRLDLACNDPAAAAAWLCEAHQALTGARDWYDAARAAAFWSRALARSGDHDSAAAQALHAHAEFVACHADLWAARAVEFLGLNAEEAGLLQEAADRYAQSLAAYEALFSDSDVLRLRDRVAGVSG